MKFETARVCVLRRTAIPRTLEVHPAQPGGEPQQVNLRPEFEYEVVAWPPGTVDGGLLPRVGDEITLPGYETPFRVVERALHWPAPSTTEARAGELQVNLAVEAVGATAVNSPPWGRPGERQIAEDGRWLEGTVANFQIRDSRKRDDAGRPVHRFMSIGFDIPGVGCLHHFVTWAWQVRAMFGPETMADLPDQEYADFGTLALLLQERTRFEVNVVPDQFGGRITIRDVRPQSLLEPGEEPNTWDANAQELTDEIWGQN